ncbi:Uma2 family endonuclease [Actinosynnema sp. NPDC053489]|uniref:Uma2 family endonuclease n=1 Tax=Actinosynnema sp. NPDC053489 TaxID=3363916 RepID=UPI0037CBA7C5
MALPADHGHDPGQAAPWFRHEGPWTVEEVLALPEDPSQRIEVVDGALLVSPLGTGRHQMLVGDFYAALRAACPSDYEVMPGVNVGLSGGRMIIPDFTVNSAGFRGLLLPVEDLLLAGEVLSPSTRLQDLVLKKQLYAEAGVPFYLIADPKHGDSVATLYELDGVEYVEVVRSTGGVLELERPFPVTIELSR